jgi:hypothetical protein
MYKCSVLEEVLITTRWSVLPPRLFGSFPCSQQYELMLSVVQSLISLLHRLVMDIISPHTIFTIFTDVTHPGLPLDAGREYILS